MTLREKQSVFAVNVARLIEHVDTLGYSCTLGEVLRTPEQAAIYAQEGKGILDSQHCKKLAIDIQLFDAHGKYLSDAKWYVDLAKFWESLHPENRSGIHFKRMDACHFEMKG